MRSATQIWNNKRFVYFIIARKEMSRLLLARVSRQVPRRHLGQWRDVRQTFLDYFEKEGHAVVGGTSLVPKDDPTLSFVNAGMNQWKHVFLGTQSPPKFNNETMNRVSCSQRCVRLSDLELVGRDGHHLTLFEMLGNWAFNNAYYKEEACHLALNLLTKVYNLDMKRLHFTVFEGCKNLDLGPDTESEGIWRSLGVPESRIRRLGPKDNFWTMGLKGPCGPCTEIYYEHDDGSLLEIWNLVFMEYNRVEHENTFRLEKLKSRHVDTGMGLERLCAVLNRSSSNYDSDLFQPLMDYIAKYSGQPSYGKTFASSNGRIDLDTGYRILSDHSRMLTACLMDGMLPETQNKLKMVIRRALRVAKDVFHSDEKLLIGLSHHVADTLDINSKQQMLKLVTAVMESEGHQYRELEEQGMRLLPKLLKDHPKACELDVMDVPLMHKLVTFLRRQQPNEDLKHLKCIDEDLAAQLHQNFGFDIHKMQTVGYMLGLSVDVEACSKAVLRAREQSKGLHTDLVLNNSDVELPYCDDRAKYKCRRDAQRREYDVNNCQAQIKALLDETGRSVDKLKEGEKGMVFLDKTCFYAEAGGQEGDQGQLIVHFSHQQSGVKFNVEDCRRVAGSENIIAHLGSVVKGEILLNSRVSCNVRKKSRQQRMLNHSGLHILNACLRKTIDLVIQTGSKVTADDFRLDINTFRREVTPSTIAEVESLANAMVASDEPVRRTTLKREKFLALQRDQKVLTLPGESYPEQVHVIKLPDGTKEACCGTHVTKTGDVQCITITGVKGANVKSIRAITGPKALMAREQGVRVLREALSLQETMAEIELEKVLHLKNVETLNKRLNQLQDTLTNNNYDIPYVVRNEVTPVINGIAQKLLGLSKERIVQEMSRELKEVVAKSANEPFVVHLLRDSKYEHQDTPARSISYNLSKLTRHCVHKPILVVRLSNEELLARACMPERLVTTTLDATQWLKAFAEVFETEVKTPTHQRPEFFANMKAVNVVEANKEEIELKLKKALRIAEEVARKALEDRKEDSASV